MKINLELLIEYRLNAVLVFLGSTLYNTGAVMFITFVFNRIPNIYGWDKWDMILIYGVGQFLGYIYLFSTYSNNHSFLNLIQKGDFDSIITKPINSIIYSTLRNFSFEHIFGLIQALTIILHALTNKYYHITLSGIIFCIISSILSLIIIHLINVITLIPTFWMQENGFYRFYPQTTEPMNYPYEIFDSKLLKFIFFYIIPYALLVNIPFRALIGKLDIRLFFLEIIVAVIYTFVTKIFWNFGLKNYQSASN